MNGLMMGQKVVKKSIINQNTSFVQIDVSKSYKINIETSSSEEMVIEAAIDGEYQKDLLLNVKEEGASVLVSAEFQPNFINPNDKLSAHKVVSIALKMKIPAEKSVHIFGRSCNVSASGNYKKLKITLSDGDCVLSKVGGIAEVTTQSGMIAIESKAASIISISKYGSINGDQIPDGQDQYELHTVTGDILLKRIE